MKTQICKIKNIQHLKAEINIFVNSGYQRCKRTEYPILKVIFKETDYNRQQKTVYFK